MVAYGAILSDPPWPERGGGRIRRGANKHYDLMTVRQIIAWHRERVPPMCAESCHLWLWVTGNRLPDGLAVMQASGFRYLNNVAWVKTTKSGALRWGLGQYLRSCHELMLLGVRGKAAVPESHNRMPSVIMAQRREHSRKPDEQYGLIERVSPGPRAELFARYAREGWDRVHDRAGTAADAAIARGGIDGTATRP